MKCLGFLHRLGPSIRDGMNIVTQLKYRRDPTSGTRWVGLFENIFDSDVEDLHYARYTKKIEQLEPTKEK